MAGPRIYSKDSLKRYILSRLGSPVVNVEITDEQLENCIADVLDIFLPRAYSGVQERFVPIQTLQGTQSYILPYNVFAVLGVNAQGLSGMGGGGAGVAYQPFSINQFVAADLYKPGVGKFDMLTYELTFEMIETLNILFGRKVTFDFNTFSKELKIHDNLLSNEPMIIQIYEKLSPHEGKIANPNFDPSTMPISSAFIDGDTTNIYDVKWVKFMSVEKARYQWGINLMKYQGSVLPNGGTLNSEGILNEAKENIAVLKEELDTEYTLPPDFFVG